MTAFRLLPREDRFYQHFVAMSGELTHAARTLEEMLAPDPPIWDKAEEIREIEHRCDFLTHQVCQQLHRAFAIPIDREDVHAIAGSLDDVMDSIEATAACIRLYRIVAVRPAARQLARIASLSIGELRLAIESLQSREGIAEHVIEINRFEEEADRVFGQALRDLLEEEKDPIALLKWKEILDSLEETIDCCEDVGDVLGGILVKHG